MHKFAVLLCLASLLACQPVVHTRNGEPVTASAGPRAIFVVGDDVGAWLAEWKHVVELPEDGVQKALKAREQVYERTADPRDGVRLALLLAQGPKPVRDQSRASKLLKELNMDKAGEGPRALAALLEQVIGEQHWAGDKITELRSKLKDSGTRIEELEQQLQEVTNIEQSIQQRD
jgi:hypothetical protein